MENETEKIFREQLDKLPSEVIDYISSEDWEGSVDKICSTYDLSDKEVSVLKREATLVLTGLTHPDFFREILKEEVGLRDETLDAISKEAEEKIFAPIRPALVSFFESENAEATEEVMPAIKSAAKESIESLATPLSIANSQTSAVSPFPPSRIWEKEKDIAPDNLPTGEPPETEPLIPPIPPKNLDVANENQPHPFEEQMKKVFTAGKQSMGELSLEPPVPQTTPPATPPRPAFADPYREPIE